MWKNKCVCVTLQLRTTTVRSHTFTPAVYCKPSKIQPLTATVLPFCTFIYLTPHTFARFTVCTDARFNRKQCCFFCGGFSISVVWWVLPHSVLKLKIFSSFHKLYMVQCFLISSQFDQIFLSFMFKGNQMIRIEIELHVVLVQENNQRQLSVMNQSYYNFW